MCTILFNKSFPNSESAIVESNSSFNHLAETTPTCTMEEERARAYNNCQEIIKLSLDAKLICAFITINLSTKYGVKTHNKTKDYQDIKPKDQYKFMKSKLLNMESTDIISFMAIPERTFDGNIHFHLFVTVKDLIDLKGAIIDIKDAFCLMRGNQSRFAVDLGKLQIKGYADYMFKKTAHAYEYLDHNLFPILYKGYKFEYK